MRVNLLAKICEDMEGVVVTAKPLWLDTERQQIAYERLNDITPVLRGYSGLAERMRMLGMTIARLHKSVSWHCPTDAILPAYPLSSFGLPSGNLAILESQVPVGWFHSDFWHGNCFINQAGSFVIIDPLPDGYTVQRGFIRACGAIDLMVMHMGLFLCHSATHHLFIDIPKLISAGDALLDGYLFAINVNDIRVRKALLQLSRLLAVNHIASYKHRLNRPIAEIKMRIATNIIHHLDRNLDWNL